MKVFEWFCRYFINSITALLTCLPLVLLVVVAPSAAIIIMHTVAAIFSNNRGINMANRLLLLLRQQMSGQWQDGWMLANGQHWIRSTQKLIAVSGMDAQRLLPIKLLWYTGFSIVGFPSDQDGGSDRLGPIKSESGSSKCAYMTCCTVFYVQVQQPIWRRTQTND